jgi:hypothetical protein
MRYTRVLTLLVAGTAAFAMAADASARPPRGHGRGGRVILRPSIGFSSPFWGGFGFGYAGWGPWGYYAFDGPGRAWQAAAEVRLQVKPRDTEVYVDGYYAGVVDDFDGTFQRLRLQPGNHTLELYLEGHRSVRQDIHTGPGATFKVKHTMEVLGPGESDGPRPEPPEEEAPAVAEPAREPAPVARITPPRRPEPARRPEPPAAEAHFGQLVLHTQPGGVEVWIDGERWPADSNGSLTLHLPAGVHRVELRRPGHESFETEMQVRAGEARELNVQLPHDGGAL